MKQSTNLKLTLGWLYPELMSTYGDRGNIIVLQKIAEKNNINLEILRINQTSDSELLNSCDIVFMGGAQDLQQEIVNKDLLESKGKKLKKLIESGIPGLYICGAYQFLGNYYKDAYGTKIPGLGVFDMYTESYKTNTRLIGNVVIKPKGENIYYVGFENHGGRTYLKDPELSFSKVIKGFGNNGEDKTEGILYKNSIGTYLHGPILPSNPNLAIKLLEKAFKLKYKSAITLEFDTSIAEKAKLKLLKRLKTQY